MDTGTVTITPLSGSIGAAITGVHLAELDDERFAEIRTAFLEHCMLVFPDQHLTTDQHVAFAERWGTFSISPFVQYLDSHPGVLPLTNRGKANAVTENWHYDSTFLPEPPALTILSARQVPVGGDTMWSNQYLAYETLSPGMQAMLDGRRALFTAARLAGLAAKNGAGNGTVAGDGTVPGNGDVPQSHHPIVRTHPETGRKAIFIGRPGDTVPRLEDMTAEESLPLIRFLYEHSTSPDRIYRHRWCAGDVVMWDNRCTMHYAVHDHGDQTRELHRISIAGDKPH